MSKTAKDKKRATDDPELLAMMFVAHAIRDLKPEQADRVLTWARARYRWGEIIEGINLKFMADLAAANRRIDKLENDLKVPMSARRITKAKREQTLA